MKVLDALTVKVSVIASPIIVLPTASKFPTVTVHVEEAVILLQNIS